MDKKDRKSRRVMWLMVVAAFALLIGAWTTLITVANRNAPDPVPVVEAE